MKLNVYAIFDQKAANFGVPFFLNNNAIAIRGFTDLTNDPKSRVNAHPEDYALYLLGEYDDGTAVIVTKKPIPLINASNVFVNVHANQLNLPLPAKPAEPANLLEAAKKNSLPRDAKVNY